MRARRISGVPAVIGATVTLTVAGLLVVGCEPDRIPTAPPESELVDFSVPLSARVASQAQGSASESSESSGGSDVYGSDSSDSGSTPGGGAPCVGGSSGSSGSTSDGPGNCGKSDAGFIEIVGGNAVSLDIGQARDLNTVFHNPSGHVVDLPNPRWSSSDPAVVSVDRNGVIIAHRSGAAAITARHGRWSDQITVLVYGGASGSASGSGDGSGTSDPESSDDGGGTTDPESSDDGGGTTDPESSGDGGGTTDPEASGDGGGAEVPDNSG